MIQRAVCKPLAAALLIACLAAVQGCASDPTKGYSFESTFDDSVQTVSVPVLKNNTEFIGIERLLTEAIANEIQRSTPWRVAAPASSDTELLGTVTRAEYRTLSNRRGTGLSEEQAFRLTVSFTWRDARTGQTRVARNSFTASGTSIQARPTNERVEVGQREAIDELAKAIVAELRSDW